MKKLIESPKEWLEFYKKLNELYNFHLEYYGPENDCIRDIQILISYQSSILLLYLDIVLLVV